MEIVGHDVAPTVIATVALPEVDLVAGARKVMEVAITIVKESGAVAKVAETFDGAITKMSSIGDKLAALSKKMEALTKGEKDVIRATESIGPRLTDGENVRGIAPSEKFLNDLKNAYDSLTAFEKSMLHSAEFKPVHNMAEDLGKERVFSLGTWKRSENTVRIAEFTGFKTDLRTGNDLRHSLVHEIGHLISDKLGTFKTPLSSMDDFVSCFRADMAQTTNAAKDAAGVLEKLFPGDEAAKLHEVWADMFAHASDIELGLESNNDYAKILKEGFPKCLEYLQNYRKGAK